MNKWFCSMCIALVCALALQTVQLPLYAQSIAVKRSISSSKSLRPIALSTSHNALSVQRLSEQLSRAIQACTDTLGSPRAKRSIKAAKVSIPSAPIADYCPQLVDLLQNKQVVSLTGVLELPVLTQLLQLLAGLGTTATAVVIAKIVFVVVAVLVLIGIVWCFANEMQCKQQTDAVKNAVLNLFHEHIMPRLRSATGNAQKTNEIQKTIVHQFDRDWKDTSTKINNGASRATLLQEAKARLEKGLNQLPQGNFRPNNNGDNNEPGRVPPRASMGEDDAMYVHYLSDEQINDIEKIDQQCAKLLRQLQKLLREWLDKFNNEYMNNKDPHISNSERTYLNKLAKSVLDRLKNHFVQLREVLVKNKNTINHSSSVEKFDQIINALPSSINEKMGLVEMKTILDKLKQYFVPRRFSMVADVVIPEKNIFINGKISISDPIFYLIYEIDFWYMFFTRVKSTIPKEVKECILIPNTACQISYINELLRNLADALHDPKKVKNECAYVEGSLELFRIFILEMNQNLYNHNVERKQPGDPALDETNAFFKIASAIKKLINRIIERK
jgi:hypothetical protein